VIEPEVQDHLSVADAFTDVAVAVPEYPVELREAHTGKGPTLVAKDRFVMAPEDVTAPDKLPDEPQPVACPKPPVSCHVPEN
jgi:hypothetical protein